MTVLTPDERRKSYNQWAAQSVNTYWEDWLVRAQLRKVINEIEDISNSEDDLVEFDRRLTYWLETAKKEIDGQ